jgi:SNF family Na+-dependent transporter
MLTKLLFALLLMAVCVVIHATGVSGALRWLADSRVDRRFWPWTGLLVRIASFTILLHLAEIAVWALAYTWSGALPDFSISAYFSAVTYTTTGYGDVVLPEEWRLVGAVEAITGILMCGWSTGFFFAVVSRLQQGRSAAPPPTE